MTDEIERRAADLGGITPVQDGDIFGLALFRAQVASEAFPALDGEIVLSFPTFGDEVEISRIAATLGGTFIAQVMATLERCIKAAPRSWYSPAPRAGDPPVLDLRKIPDSVMLVTTYNTFIAWRDSFRGKGAI